MNLKIVKRKLSEDEIELLFDELKKFPDIGVIGKHVWNKLGDNYIATINNQFAGICIAVNLKGWVKLGPLAILEKFQHQGIGKKLFTYVVEQYQQVNIYVGSSSPIVWKMVEELGFKKEHNYFNLPYEIKYYLIMYICQRLTLDFIADAFRKRIIGKRERYFFFLRYSN